MGLVGLIFILAAAVTAALAYFLKGNVVWKTKDGCTAANVCGDASGCCAYFDSIDNSFGMCREGTLTGPPSALCEPKTDILPLSLSVATVALLFTGLIVLLIPGGGGDEKSVALHLG